MFRVAGNRGLDYFLDVPEEIDFVLGAEGYGEASGTGASCSADAVYVCFRFVGKIVVHNQADIFHIHAPGRDVGGDEDGDKALLEFRESFLALRLRFIAMDSLGGEAGGCQCLGDLVGSVFGAVEDDGEFC